MPFKPTIIAKEPIHNFSVEFLTQRLEAERGHVSSSDQQRHAAELSKFRKRFTELTEKSRSLFSNPLIYDAQLSMLSGLASEVLTVSKLIYAELEKLRTLSEPIVAPAIVNELLELNQQQLDRLENQLWLIESVDGYADHLHEAVEELRHARTLGPGRFQILARRIILDVHQSSGSQLLMPELGLSLSEHLSRRGQPADAWVYAAGIQSARLIVWSASHGPAWEWARQTLQREGEAPAEPRTREERLGRSLALPRTSYVTTQVAHANWGHRLELLTLAALLQDVGLLALISPDQSPVELLADENAHVFERHPVIGAALVAGIDQYSVDLPYLVAQHHERLDGTGYPDHLYSRSLSPSSHFLGIVSRFVELMEKATGNQEAPLAQSASHAAAVQLYREAEQGEFDPALTIALLKSLDFELQTEPMTATDERSATISGLDANRFRQDAAHLDLSEPHAGHEPPAERQEAEPVDSEQTVPAPQFRRRRRRRRSSKFSAYARKDSP